MFKDLRDMIYTLLLLMLFSCCQRNADVKANVLHVTEESVIFEILGQHKGSEIIIKDTTDLGNRKCRIPKGVTLRFKGGIIKNGTLIGNETKIKTTKTCFNRVKIEGTWNVPVIKSSMFGDLSYDNALKDVVALANPEIKNKIIIEKGNYQVTAYRNGDVCLPLCSNTDFVLNGTITLTPNNYTNYYIIQAEGNNIKIHGNGSIIGDKHTHTGNKGEWGMGVDLKQAHHVSIYGLTIKDCWGDCIYVGTESSNVKIKDCKLDNGRRQGISITSANGVKISNCTISNVYGTAPEYAIDVEPNKDQIVDNVTIKNVSVNNCKGGFLVWGGAPNAKIGTVSIKNCSIETTQKRAIQLVKCTYAKVNKCIIKSSHKDPIYHEKVGEAVIRNTKIE